LDGSDALLAQTSDERGRRAWATRLTGHGGADAKDERVADGVAFKRGVPRRVRPQIPGCHFFHWDINLTAHCLWPSRAGIQWHHLHHTNLADVYSANTPSTYDETHSKDMLKYKERLAKDSLWIRRPSVVEVVQVPILAAAVLLYYWLGTGPMVEWGLVERVRP
jgi:hypothetical protein